MSVTRYLVRAITMISAALLMTAAHAEVKKMTYTTHTSDDAPQMKAVYEYLDLVNAGLEKLGKPIKWTFYTAGSIAGATEGLESVKSGISDSGYVLDIYHPKQFKTSSTWGNLSILGSDAIRGTLSSNKLFTHDCPDCLADFKESNIVPIVPYASSGYRLMCTKPISDLSSLKGKRIRGTSAWARLTDHLGGTVVNVSISELYEALQRGMVDCTDAPLNFLKDYAIWDSIKYVLDLPLGAFQGGALMGINLDTWQRMDPEQRSIFIKHAPTLARGVAQYYTDEEAAVKEQAQKEKGVKWLTPTDDVIEAVTQFKQDELARVTSSLADSGVSNADQLVETMTDAMQFADDTIKTDPVDYADYEKTLGKDAFGDWPAYQEVFSESFSDITFPQSTSEP